MATSTSLSSLGSFRGSKSCGAPWSPKTDGAWHLFSVVGVGSADVH